MIVSSRHKDLPFSFRECLWTLQLGVSFSPHQGIEAFPNPSVNVPAGLVSELVFCHSSLFVAPFPETCQFCCLWTSLDSLQGEATICYCNVGLNSFTFIHIICSQASFSEKIYNQALDALVVEKDCTWVAAQKVIQNTVKKLNNYPTALGQRIHSPLRH